MVIFHSFLYVYQRVILWNNNNSQRLIKYSRYSPTEASAEWKPPPWLWPSAVQQLQTGDSWKVRNVSSFKKRGLSNCGNGRSTIYKIYMEHPALIDGFPIKISICKRFPARHGLIREYPKAMTHQWEEELEAMPPCRPLGQNFRKTLQLFFQFTLQ